MARKIVAGNWKMNLNASEVKQLLNNLKAQEKVEGVELVVCPHYTGLADAVSILEGTNVKVGAQDCSANENGAYTGEISAAMLKSYGVTHVILGHSERRAYHGENSELLKAKLHQALAQNLEVLFCCGETLDQRENEDYIQIINTQIKEVLTGLNEKQWKLVTIAYEPVWAIGTGKTASPEQAQEVHAAIRKMLRDTYGDQIAQSTSILYGGSCKPSNAKEIFGKNDVDGGLIGGAALVADDFLAIAQSYS